jgi:hypothetical protein
VNPSERIDELIAELTDWRGKMFASIRMTILDADREIIRGREFESRRPRHFFSSS